MTLPPVQLGRTATVVLDVAVWAAIHALTGYAAHRCSTERLAADSWLTRPRRWERDGRVYERIRIRRWKDRLPEAGALCPGGVSKRALPAGGRHAIHRFVPETRRAEYAHWWCIAASPVFVLWNPLSVMPVMFAYAVIVNLPFIVIQRYNRLRVLRITTRRTRTSRPSSSSSSATTRRRRTGSNIPYGSPPVR